MRAPPFVPLLLLLGACASQPTNDARPEVPDRVTANRPDGTVPDGLADVRSTLADQRATTLERENALSASPTQLTTTPTTPWYSSWLSDLGRLVSTAASFSWLF